ncbi:Fur family transcriptional regulator [Candidatus Epulonipiscium viviparus]|uniref:Fur family transcriptional regulator n=1 Tax=Candidatus Epulonipiscium viviparus TaxID=420336 RepID=UPI002738151F|nr:transcriptional repressor [Candidatus Epulopiscium viviparus]
MKQHRQTIQKTLVLDAIHELKSHVTAAEVYELIIKKHPTISKGTVYRNLNQLAQNNKIKKIVTASGAERFDHSCHDHYHAVCVHCNKMIDVEMPYMSKLESTIKDAEGFVFSGHDIVFQGVCSECAKQNNN